MTDIECAGVFRRGHAFVCSGRSDVKMRALGDRKALILTPAYGICAVVTVLSVSLFQLGSAGVLTGILTRGFIIHLRRGPLTACNNKPSNVS